MRQKIKYPYQGSVDWCIWRWMDIEDTEHLGYVYLRRLVIFKTPYFGLYIHWIHTRDGDRAPHNHPMSFLSWVLRGGYTENRWCYTGSGLPTFLGERRRRRFSLARTTRQDFHIITTLTETPTITVLFCGPRRQDWGFLQHGEFIDYRTYLDILPRSA